MRRALQGLGRRRAPAALVVPACALLLAACGAEPLDAAGLERRGSAICVEAATVPADELGVGTEGRPSSGRQLAADERRRRLDRARAELATQLPPEEDERLFRTMLERMRIVAQGLRRQAERLPVGPDAAEVARQEEMLETATERLGLEECRMEGQGGA